MDSRFSALVGPPGYIPLWKRYTAEYHCVSRHLVKEIGFRCTLFVSCIAIDGHIAVMLNAAKSRASKWS